MKRIIALFLCAAIFLTSCSQSQPQETNPDNTPDNTSSEIVEPVVWEDAEPHYNALDDTLLLAHIEDAFNSQSNIYFGYTLDELNVLFQGTRYIFTLGENGNTTVQELQEIEDVNTDTILKNVAIGTGVILVCVTVSIVSAEVGAPAVSMIFAVSATTAETMALSSAAFGGISAGIVRGIQTGDFNEAIEAAALSGSEGFKWGAITGAVLGGTSEAFLLKVATQNGLTMNQAAIIQADSGLPIDVISQMHSLDEYLVYKDAGLKPIMVNGRTALVQNIDLDYISQLPDGTEVTNLVRMQRGYAPLDPATGKAYQLHHIGQKADATLAVLTESQHQGNAAILNIFSKESEIVRPEFATTRKEFWEYMGRVVFANGGI